MAPDVDQGASARRRAAKPATPIRTSRATSSRSSGAVSSWLARPRLHEVGRRQLLVAVPFEGERVVEEAPLRKECLAEVVAPVEGERHSVTIEGVAAGRRSGL